MACWPTKKEDLNARPDQRSRSCDLQLEEKADRKSGSVHCLPFPIVLKVHRLKQVISRGLFGLAPISNSNRKISLMKGWLPTVWHVSSRLSCSCSLAGTRPFGYLPVALHSSYHGYLTGSTGSGCILKRAIPCHFK